MGDTYEMLATEKCIYFHNNTESTGRYVGLIGLLVHVCCVINFFLGWGGEISGAPEMGQPFRQWPLGRLLDIP